MKASSSTGKDSKRLNCFSTLGIFDTTEKGISSEVPFFRSQQRENQWAVPLLTYFKITAPLRLTTTVKNHM